VQLKIEIFTPVSYYGRVDTGTWPTPPRCYDLAQGTDSMRKGLEQSAATFAAGFDSLNFAEHHYSTAQLSPDPITYADILVLLRRRHRLPRASGRRTVRVAGFGHPVRLR
jgi:hypothetical protein